MRCCSELLACRLYHYTGTLFCFVCFVFQPRCDWFNAVQALQPYVGQSASSLGNRNEVQHAFFNTSDSIGKRFSSIRRTRIL